MPEPGPTDVVVANVMAGVNFNGVWASHGQPVDVVAGNSAYDPDSIGFHICGSESSGIVAAVGSEVTAVKIGDKVIVSAGQFDSNDPMIRKGSSPELAPSYRIWGYESSWGAFGEFSRVQERQCMPKPDELGWEQAATCLATGVPVHRMLTHWQGNQIKPGDVVLVWGGSGGLGAAAIRQVVAHGGRPVAVVSSPQRAEFCRSIGAVGCLDRRDYAHWGNITELNEDGYRQWIVSATRFRNCFFRVLGQRRLPDIVIEHPGADTLPTSLFICAPGGMVALCGATSGFDASLDLRFLWMYQKRLQGSHSGDIEDLHGYFDLLRAYDIGPVVTRIYGWEELPRAHADLERGCVMGKVVVRIADPGKLEAELIS